jgi:hypothetical protein
MFAILPIIVFAAKLIRRILLAIAGISSYRLACSIGLHSVITP